MKSAIASLLVLAAVAHADKFTVRLKMQDAKGKLAYVPVGEITRTNGKITSKSIPVPQIDKLATKFIADWNAMKRPPSVTVTETIASDTGMHPSWDKHSVTFTPKDKLYLPALVREFCAKRGYEPLGITSMTFIEFDSSAESPPGADDASSTRSNFRKGTGKELFDGIDYFSFFIKAPLRKVSMGHPDGVLRASAKDPKLGVAQDQDDGKIVIVALTIYKDGRVELVPDPADKQFERNLSGMTNEEVDVSLITDATTWKHVKIKKSSPLFLEAYLVGVLEQNQFYDVQPVIDPVVFE